MPLAASPMKLCVWRSKRQTPTRSNDSSPLTPTAMLSRTFPLSDGDRRTAHQLGDRVELEKKRH
jgi:hypothetical protein